MLPNKKRRKLKKAKLLPLRKNSRMRSKKAKGNNRGKVLTLTVCSTSTNFTPTTSLWSLLEMTAVVQSNKQPLFEME